MAAWPLDTSISRSSLQFGQSSQPRPDPVNRTAAPLITMAMSRPSATTVTCRYRCGVIRTPMRLGLRC